MRSPSLALAALLAAASRTAHGVEPIIEVEFEPVGNDDPEALVGLLNGQLMGGGPVITGSTQGWPPLRQGGKASTHHREDELDKAIEAMVGGLFSSIGKPSPQLIRGGSHPFGGSHAFHPFGGHHHASHSGPRPEDILLGGNVVMQDFPFGRPARGHKDTLPVDLFKDLFPGPLIIEEGPSTMHSFGGGPDPLILDMLSDLHGGFQDDMLPMLHSAAAAMRTPNTCHKDLQAHCATSRSQLHCLGQHQEDISEVCRKDVGKSVPFVCSKEIDTHCDLLSGGILPCLETQMPSLGVNCKDAVVATRTVISKANTQKVSLVEKTTGQKKTVNPPPFEAILEMARQRASKFALPRGSSGSWTKHLLLGLALAGLALLVYRWPVSVLGPKGAYNSWFKKLGFSAGEKDSSEPLRGVELPKPTELFLA